MKFFQELLSAFSKDLLSLSLEEIIIDFLFKIPILDFPNFALIFYV
jgi:hypothetical protein